MHTAFCWIRNILSAGISGTKQVLVVFMHLLAIADTGQPRQD